MEPVPIEGQHYISRNGQQLVVIVRVVEVSSTPSLDDYFQREDNDYYDTIYGIDEPGFTARSIRLTQEAEDRRVSELLNAKYTYSVSFCVPVITGPPSTLPNAPVTMMADDFHKSYRKYTPPVRDNTPTSVVNLNAKEEWYYIPGSEYIEILQVDREAAKVRFLGVTSQRSREVGLRAFTDPKQFTRIEQKSTWDRLLDDE